MFCAILLVLVFVYIGMDSVIEDIRTFVHFIKNKTKKK